MLQQLANSIEQSLTEFIITVIEDLIYYDGPLLSLVKDQHDQLYLYLWIDSDDACNRWLAFRVTEDLISQYKDGKLSLHDLVYRNDTLLIIDLDEALMVRSTYSINTVDFPKDLGPSEDSFFSI